MMPCRDSAITPDTYVKYNGKLYESRQHGMPANFEQLLRYNQAMPGAALD